MRLTQGTSPINRSSPILTDNTSGILLSLNISIYRKFSLHITYSKTITDFFYMPYFGPMGTSSYSPALEARRGRGGFGGRGRRAARAAGAAAPAGSPGSAR